jgi:hypothetical protein
MTRFLCGLAAGVLAATAAWADVESGPKVGEKVGELKAFGVVGPVEGKEVDYAAERKDEPTVYLFIAAENFSRPMARFLKTLDGKLGEAGGDKAVGVAVWLTADSDKSKEYLPRAQTSLNFEKTALAVLGDKSGPNGWGINPDAHLTVVVAYKGNVVKSFAYTSVNETDARAVLAELKKAVGK